MSVSSIASFIHQFTSTRGLEPASEDEQGVWTLQLDGDVLLSLQTGPDEGQITVLSSPGYVEIVAQARGQGDDGDVDADGRLPAPDVDLEPPPWDIEVDRHSRLLTLSRHCEVNSLDAESFAALIDAYVVIYMLWETQLSAEPVDVDGVANARVRPAVWPLEGLA